MCGRYRLKNAAALKEECRRLFGITYEELLPRYNVAPSQSMPVIAADAAGVPQAATMRWGFVPFWDKSEKPKIAPINARAEEAMQKPMFRQSLQKRRCLVPADGFYEWRRVTEKLKQPYDIHLRDDRPFFLAGIYEAASETRPDTYLVFTTRPNALMERIHDRMPVILTGDRARDWIRPGPLAPAELESAISPFPAEEMAATPVSTLVNNPRNDGPDCILGITETWKLP